MPKPLLCVNIDHVATLRQARCGQDPNVCIAAEEAESAGADGITFHLREDRRHIQDADIYKLKHCVKGRLTMEMAATEEMLEIACKLRPDLLTIVPERRAELTTEGGLVVSGNERKLNDFLQRISGAGLKASLFVDPEPINIEAARAVGAGAVELHTGTYANACKNRDDREREIQLGKLREAAQLALSFGMKVNAGHGLDLENLKLLTIVDCIDEFHIGHAIIARAIFVGLKQSVREVKALLS